MVNFVDALLLRRLLTPNESGAKYGIKQALGARTSLVLAAAALDNHLLFDPVPPQQANHNQRLEQHHHGLAVGADGVPLEHVVDDGLGEEEHVCVDRGRRQAHQGLGLPHSRDLGSLVFGRMAAARGSEGRERGREGLLNAAEYG